MPGDFRPGKRTPYSAQRRYRGSGENGAFTKEDLHLRIQAGSGTAGGVRAEHRGSGAVTGHRRADTVELDQGAESGQAEGQRARLEVDRRADRARGQRRFRVATTDSNHTSPIAPNLLDRNFTVEKPNTVRAAKDAVLNWVLWYDQKRIYSTIGYQCPVEYEQAWQLQRQAS